jgi:hypothetical protein
MRRFTLLAAAAVMATAGCGGGDDDAAPAPGSGPTPTTTATAAARAAEPILAVSSGADGTRLSWVDGMTLEPVDGRSAAVPFSTAVGELSPDGTEVAVGASEGGSVGIVDLEEMRTLGRAETTGSFVQQLHWAAPDLLLAAIGGVSSQAVAIDPQSAEVLGKHDLGGTILYAEEAPGALVFLVAPSTGIGPARVVVFDGGQLRSARLGQVPAGWEQAGESEEDYRARQSVPALAVEPSGARALVVPAGDRVAEVDLTTMAVSYHDLAEPVSLLGRLRDWLEPAAHAKGLDGPDRNAVWLPNGLVAVSGNQYVQDGDEVDVTPAGLALIDPGDWSVRRLSDEPGWATFRDGALLASAWREGSNEQTLVVFDPDGTRRFTLAREDADLSQTHAGLLYATTSGGTRFEIVDLQTGETVAVAKPRRATHLLYLD